jgi:anthranilate phosphoribosyltransferase
LCAPTVVREVREQNVHEHEWQAADFGLPECGPEDLAASGPQESAARIQAILEGQVGPAADVVLANAAAALLAAERVSNLRRGVDCARQIVRDKQALEVLHRLAAYSRKERINDAPSAVK